MKVLSLAFALLVSLPLFAPIAANATIDCNYPVTSHQWTGKITSGVRVRDLTCMDSNVLGTITGGTVVGILGEADGWYLVKTSTGLKGYVWQDFITVTDKTKFPTFTITKETTEPVKEEYVKETYIKETYTKDATLIERVKGRILLQVENNGEAWYVRPDDGKRYYMKDGQTAYEMMRAFGLGISNADFEKLKGGNYDLKTRLKGKIVLKVESLGEAYYIHPSDGGLHYLKNGEEAYRIMRELSLGITNKDLSQIVSKEFTALPVQPVEKEETVVSYEGVEAPEGIDLDTLNEYWLNKINSLRAAKGLRQLVLDQRWVNTAAEWAAYMGSLNTATHDRPDGKTMHQWIDTKGLDFTERYSIDGWSSNYFTENIAYGWANESTTEAVKGVLDDTLEFYLSEASYNGAHYRTIYHPDWNSVGVGFSFRPDGNGYKVFVAIHYGSLVL